MDLFNLRNDVRQFLLDRGKFKALLDLYGKSTNNPRLPSIDSPETLYLLDHLATGRLDSKFNNSLWNYYLKPLLVHMTLKFLNKILKILICLVGCLTFIHTIH